ncbi:Na(+)-translocating NADH-quinone reductase subunit A [Ferrimonas sp. SCSIO 43195]|uniref:Na(+)-translocating NADH-quinone reductase subunit A n=1 Tax=Ferrimonas sp. SCSIO 43195 TaxID=2822844 RepID=UPI002075C048|nr:Na(+)-translocating NADH-quinone reductase subunit A [Ferrimonas sp. SCSIO 43195]USD38421.1 Na(+)-translocating NADH-quinone reductase subunit A [Ferrimonas sp. SCSIO 43195]
MASSSDQVKTITKGLDVPIAGQPRQLIESSLSPSHVALLGEEYAGLKPTMMVEVGDVVKKGQPLFEDKKNKGVIYTAPASGVVTAIHRGARRVLQSVVIRIEGEEAMQFDAYDDLTSLSRTQAQSNLIRSGLWTALRTRPFSRAPQPGSAPAGIFVTAMDTNPLAADPRIIIDEQARAFADGLAVLTALTDHSVHLCHDDQGSLPGHDLPRVESHRFGGVHPAGLVGTHIHHILPVSLERQVWHIGYQDVIAVGKLFTTGELYTDRVVSLAGPSVAQPRLVRVPQGSELTPLLQQELKPGFSRVVSGSLLSGHTAAGPRDFLGRYHNQISALTEDTQRQLMPWARPSRQRFSIARAVTSLFTRNKKFDLTTHSGGSKRAIVAYGQFEKVMPLDILPTLLLRDLICQDTDEAQALGALELDEEDLALCTFICPSKYDFGKELRTCLDIIEKEG